MSKRSLIASASGRLIAKQSFQRTGWTQEYLAYQAGLETRQPVWKFFSGRPVERHVFIEICFQLNLTWEEIAERPEIVLEPAIDPPVATESQGSVNSDATEFAALKETVRAAIERRCGFMQASLEASNALPLAQLYTDVNVLPYLTQQRWLEVTELSSIDVNLQPLRLNELSTASTPALSVAQSQTRLMLMGKPGAGKTTFLRHLALQCVNGQFRSDCIPVFVSLRTLMAEANPQPSFDLADYLETCWVKDGLLDQGMAPLLKAGKILVLLDGLDEVATADLPDLQVCLQRFADRYYQSPIIITSRIASVPLTLSGFHYAEVADLTQAQIEQSVERYFGATEPHAPTLARQFLAHLEQADNAAIRELVATPILLHLLCRVFQDRKTFPAKRAKLYQVGLETLLVRWDQARGIHRSSNPEAWSVADKMKLLSHIAAHFFEQERYFFDKIELVQCIAQYLQAEKAVSADTEQLWFLSEEILRVFETQHGLLVQRAHHVYSFSHLTFQEYLTARKISATSEPLLPDVLQQLARKIDIPHWREVISMTSGLLSQPQLLLDPLLQTIEQTVDENSEIQTLLAQVQQKVEKTSLSLDPTALRLFYLALSQNWEWGTAIALDPRIAESLPVPLELDLALARLFHQCGRLEAGSDYRAILNLYFALNLEPKYAIPEPWRSHWQASIAELPALDLGKDSLLTWWHHFGGIWCQKFRRVLATQCFGGAEPLSGEPRRQLVLYYERLQFFITSLKEATLPPDLRRKLQGQVLSSPGSNQQPLARPSWGGRHAPSPDLVLAATL